MAPTPQLTLASGHSIPAVGYGAGTTWFKGAKGEEALRDAVVVALDAGFTHIDDAEMYENEAAVGAGIRQWLEKTGRPRSELFVTSKVLGSIRRDGIEAGCRRTLASLGLEYLDLYLMHAPFSPTGEAFETPLPALWAQMEGLVAAGLVRSIGVSNFRVADLKAILAGAAIKPCLNQVELHLRLQQPRLAAFCAEQGVVMAAYGSLVPITAQDAKEEGGAGAPVRAAVEAVAAAHSVGPEQVLLARNLQRGIVCITTTTKPERLGNFLDAPKVTLTASELESLEAAGAAAPLRTFWDKATVDWEAE